MKSKAFNFIYVPVKKNLLTFIMTLLADFTERSTALRYANFPLNSKFSASVSRYTSGFTHALSPPFTSYKPSHIDKLVLVCMCVWEGEIYDSSMSKWDLVNAYLL